MKITIKDTGVFGFHKWHTFNIDAETKKQAAYLAVFKIYPWLKKRLHKRKVGKKMIIWGGKRHIWDGVTIKYQNNDYMMGFKYK